MPNRSRKSWSKSWKDGSASKGAPRPSNLEFEATSSRDRISTCLSECLDAFGDSIFPRDEDFDKICVVVSSESLFQLYCCDSRCGVQRLPQKGQDPNVNDVIVRCKRFGILVEDPGPPEAESCSWEDHTAASSTPTLKIEAVSNNSPPSSIQSLLAPQPSKSISLSQNRISSPPLSTSPTPTHTIQQSAKSLIGFEGFNSNYPGPSMGWSTSMASSVPRMSSTRASPATVPYPRTSPANKMSRKPTSTISPLVPSPTNNPQAPSSLWQNMSSEAQAGLIIGLCILTVCLVLITLYILDKYKRRHISPSQHATFNPKTTLDSAGIRWPEKVILYGDAKDFHTWTRQYEKEHRFRTSLREGQYGIETGTLAGSWVG